MKSTVVCCSAFVFFSVMLATPALAQDEGTFNYNYVEGEYANFSDNVIDENAVQISGSWALSKNLFGRWGYTRGWGDALGVDFAEDNYSIGGGANFSLIDNIDLNLGAAYSRAVIHALGISEGANVFTYGAGLRIQATDLLEFQPFTDGSGEFDNGIDFDFDLTWGLSTLFTLGGTEGETYQLLVTAYEFENFGFGIRMAF